MTQRITSARQEVDKQLLYGKFQKSEDDHARFAKRMAHKAADLAMEDDLNITTTKTGVSTPGLLGIAGIAGASLLGYGYMNRDQPAVPQSPPAAVAPVTPADSDYEIRFWDRDGNPIEVERVPAELRKQLWEQATK